MCIRDSLDSASSYHAPEFLSKEAVSPPSTLIVVRGPPSKVAFISFICFDGISRYEDYLALFSFLGYQTLV